MYKIERGEMTIKALAITSQEIEAVFDYLKEKYRVEQQSRLMENDRDPGYHSFIVLKTGQEEGD